MKYVYELHEIKKAKREMTKMCAVNFMRDVSYWQVKKNNPDGTFKVLEKIYKLRETALKYSEYKNQLNYENNGTHYVRELK